LTTYLADKFPPLRVCEAGEGQGWGENVTLSPLSAVRRIASLGEFRGRKSDGEPAATTTWRGLERLSAMVEG